jgi:nicotinamidase-related amidase
MHMDAKKTALVMIGYQNDYFAKDGILRGVVEEPGRVDEVLDNTIGFVRALLEKGATVVSTPIILHADYRAMASPGGILHTMKEVGAFAAGTKGAENIEELEKFGDDIVYVGGKIGFNAFANTELETILRGKDIESVLICGMVTSLCIDSSGRAAYERGYDVTIVSDCTSGRTATEHEFYCQSVFPLYGAAKASDDILASMH